MSEQDRRRPEVAPEFRVLYRIYGWAVEFGKGYRSMILEEPDALKYAVRHRGIVKPLYERVEVLEDPAKNPGTKPV